MRKVLVVTGMTASGKSQVALDLAKQFNGEIISADSVAIYQKMDIGSAKIGVEQQQGIPHHLIDQLDYHQQYNVRDFQQQARRLIEEISLRGKLPIVVGGSGLYIRALLYDYQFADESQPLISVDHYQPHQLVEILKRENPKALETIHENNVKRLRRAVQVTLSSPTIKKEEPIRQEMLYDAKVLIFNHERSLLYQRIDQRVDTMIELGLEQEVRSLIHDSSDWELGSMSAIGYREFKAYFDQEITLEMCIEKIKKDTRNFAKRQTTWFKHQVDGTWVDMQTTKYAEIEEEIRIWLENR